ncbi:polyadenylate-binding protein 2 [Cavenderia fasciculata]|uniref:Polyadenylate-binding protein 2 n=1 Tax=Cavenderia fasciculata TaxID=261658 RepID=F4PQQ4_CACFS|nr:polyadenylate-binding protein 2 [Cavenderia fasciculata]EGG22012.1 polyadenylate-binding protein 2 [Cavenderia fasciculata]|eukprot:XP_004359863.1 polyadenylate-binding protein 2 [Cavenderia fasciculata]
MSEEYDAAIHSTSDEVDIQQPSSSTNNNNNDNDNDQSTDDTNTKNEEDENSELNQDPELEEMKRRYKEIEEETQKLKELQNSLEANGGFGGDQEETDGRSVYVGNVEYTSTQEEILLHFQPCGTIHRITILNDKMTGHPKGCCYIEFLEREAVTNALMLNETMFKDRQIKVTPKRTNLPSYMRGGGARGARGGRGSSAYGYGGFNAPRGGGPVRGAYGGGFGGPPRGRGGRGRGGANFYHPYA